MDLESPLEPEWRAGRLAIGYEEDRDLLVLEVEEFVPGDEDEDEDDDEEEAPQERRDRARSGRPAARRRRRGRGARPGVDSGPPGIRCSRSPATG